MKSKLRTTFDHYGKCITGHIEDTQMYEDVKSGKRKWESYQYSKITHIRIPKEVFERLLELEDIKELYDQKSREVDILKSLITQKEDEAYNKGYADATRDIFKDIKERLKPITRVVHNGEIIYECEDSLDDLEKRYMEETE